MRAEMGDLERCHRALPHATARGRIRPTAVAATRVETAGYSSPRQDRLAVGTPRAAELEPAREVGGVADLGSRSGASAASTAARVTSSSQRGSGGRVRSLFGSKRTPCSSRTSLPPILWPISTTAPRSSMSRTSPNSIPNAPGDARQRLRRPVAQVLVAEDQHPLGRHAHREFAEQVAHGPARRGQGQHDRPHPARQEMVLAQEMEAPLALKPPVVAGDGGARVAHQEDHPRRRIVLHQEQCAGRLLGRIAQHRLARGGRDRLRDRAGHGRQSREVRILRPGPPGPPEPLDMRLLHAGGSRLVPGDPGSLDLAAHLVPERAGADPGTTTAKFSDLPMSETSWPTLTALAPFPSRILRIVLPLWGRPRM